MRPRLNITPVAGTGGVVDLGSLLNSSSAALPPDALAVLQRVHKRQQERKQIAEAGGAASGSICK
jgi:hypothetical protein